MSRPASERSAELARQLRAAIGKRPSRTWIDALWEWLRPARSAPVEQRRDEVLAEWADSIVAGDDATWDHIERLRDSVVARADARADAIWEHVEGLRALARQQDDRIRTLTDEARFLDGRLRQTISELRALRRAQEIAGAVERPLDGPRFERVLQQLAAELPSLDRRTAIEVSMQSAADEDLLSVAAHVLGARLSVLGSSYRVPNDAWIHVDFTPFRTRAGLLENAAARLSSGGLLVIVTHAPAEGFPSHPQLRRLPTVVLPCDGLPRLEAAVWERT